MLAASARGVLTANARRQSTTSSRRCLSSLAQSLSFDSGELNCRRTLVPITLKPVISQSSIRWFSPTAIASADLPYHIVVGMPALSPTMEQGIISKWNVKEGDSFAAGDSLAVIETDKASMDFEAQDDGVVAKILVSEGGDATNCGSPIMVTVEDTGEVGAFANFSSAGAAPPAAPSPKRDVATPAPAAAIPKPAVDLPYHIVVGMPALSPTMEQGTISKWNVAEGDSFAAGDSLAVIETDKASMDFEAQDDGVVAKLLVKEGTSDVKVGTEIMVTVEDTADVGAFASFVAGLSAAPASSSASTPPPVTAPSPKRDVATPAPAAAIPAPTAVTLAAPTAAPAAAVTAAPSGAISLGGTEWGLLAAVKSPLAKMMASKQKEYISKYGSSGHVPVV